MFVTVTWKEIQEFIDTPQKKPNPVKPEVEILLIGEYRVTGSNGKFYQVVFGYDDRRNVFAACTCLGNMYGRACRHIKAAWPIHCQLADINIEF